MGCLGASASYTLADSTSSQTPNCSGAFAGGFPGLESFARRSAQQAHFPRGPTASAKAEIYAALRDEYEGDIFQAQWAMDRLEQGRITFQLPKGSRDFTTLSGMEPIRGIEAVEGDIRTKKRISTENSFLDFTRVIFPKVADTRLFFDEILHVLMHLRSLGVEPDFNREIEVDESIVDGGLSFLWSGVELRIKPYLMAESGIKTLKGELKFKFHDGEFKLELFISDPENAGEAIENFVRWNSISNRYEQLEKAKELVGWIGLELQSLLDRVKSSLSKVQTLEGGMQFITFESKSTIKKELLDLIRQFYGEPTGRSNATELPDA